jgi:hypothetical protein
MPDASRLPLTDRHLFLFGSIIHWFARYEGTMEAVMSAVCGASHADVMLLTRRLDFGARREALLDLLRRHGTPMDRLDRICAHLLVPHTHMPLWRDIVHSAWRSGRHPESVQPNWILNLPSTITAVTEDLDRPSEQQIVRDDREFTYSIEDLRDIERLLAENHRAMSKFLHESGLLPPADSGANAR